MHYTLATLSWDYCSNKSILKGHIYESIKNIYQNPYCSVNVNNMLMDWFDINAGVKQGDSLSPTMFGIFINDIVEDIKSVKYRHRERWS